MDRDKFPPLDGSPDNDYVGQVVYENRKNNQWLTRFMAAKHLNILIEVNAYTFILNITYLYIYIYIYLYILYSI